MLMEATRPNPPAAPCSPIPEQGPSRARSPDLPPHWQSQQLFGAHAEVTIGHGGAVYRLRITSLGKLILTK